MLTGLTLITISAIGTSIAPDYQTMLIVYALVGIGQSMVNPMTTTLVGEYLPREKQSQAIGWLIAGNSLSYLLGAPLMAYLTSIGDWRTVFQYYIIPVSLLSLLVTQYGIPKEEASTDKSTYSDIVHSIETVLTNTSALSCLVSNAFLMTAYQAVLVYSASFYRETFGLSRSFVSNFVIAGAFLFTIGSVGSSKIVKYFGRKRIIVSTSILGAILIGLFTNTSNLWLSVSFRLAGGFFMAVAFSGVNALMLEQVPQFRGTVMSLGSAIGSIGAALGTLVGGVMLINGGYSLVAISLGAFSVISGILIFFFSKERS
jgi:predicted MFS family arabinose efflux permease